MKEFPIFAGLSASANAVLSAKKAKKKLEEEQRHHKTIEVINGSSLNLKKKHQKGVMD